MGRISVVGTSGAGKTTVGSAIAAQLGVPFLELDSIRHQSGWKELPDEEFRLQVAAFVAATAWVVDGNYREIVGAIVRDRATEVVWLDLPRWSIMRQVIWRSFTRAAFRRELWNGNRELFRRWLDHDHPIRWAWSTAASRRDRYREQMATSPIPWTRLTSRAAVRRYLRDLR